VGGKLGGFANGTKRETWRECQRGGVALGLVGSIDYGNPPLLEGNWNLPIPKIANPMGKFIALKKKMEDLWVGDLLAERFRGDNIGEGRKERTHHLKVRKEESGNGYT